MESDVEFMIRSSEHLNGLVMNIIWKNIYDLKNMFFRNILVERKEDFLLQEILKIWNENALGRAQFGSLEEGLPSLNRWPLVLIKSGVRI